MRKQDQLLSLIKSLTPAEKKYFVQTAKADGQAKSYLKLYEALLKVDAYNADELSKALGKKKADLANEKKYLEVVLLKCLRLFHEKDMQVELRNEMAVSTLLAKRGLHAYALQRLEKAKQLAEESDNFFALAEVRYQMRVNEESGWKVNLGDYVSLLNALSDTRNALADANALVAISEMEVNFQKIKKRREYLGDEMKQFEDMLTNPVLNVTYKSPVLELARLTQLGIVYHVLRKYELSARQLEKTLPLLEKYNYRVSNSPERQYVYACGNVIYNYLLLRDLDAAEAMISKLEKYKGDKGLQTQLLKPLLLADTNKHRLNLFSAQMLYGKASASKIKAYLKHFAENKAAIKQAMFPDTYIGCLCQIAGMELYLSEPGKALNWLNELIHGNDPKIDYNGPAIAKQLQVIAHYEMGNYTLLPSLIKSALRYYKERKILGEVDKEFFLLIPKLVQQQFKPLQQAKLMRDFYKIASTIKPHNTFTLSFAERQLAKLGRGVATSA